jgi:predicted AlkP superfamily pyrophosphatase or phosphodiesterase
MRRTFVLVFAIASLLGGVTRLWAWQGQAEHVVVVVWDGMRPDYVRAQYTPTLHELASRGTFFKNHHSSYITSTEVNCTALATGTYPDHSGVLANQQYRPDLNYLGVYGTENFDAVRRGDLISDGHYLGASTVPEILQQHGFPTIIAGAKPVALLLDRAAKTTPAQSNSVTLFQGQTLPRAMLKTLEAMPEVGPFPKSPTEPDAIPDRALFWINKGKEKFTAWLNGKPKRATARLNDTWTTRALVHGLWKEGVPKFTVLWLSEPDASQHELGVGSPNAEAALEHCDKNLALVIKTLKDKGVYDRTDLFVVSDHGFSTVDRGPDVLKALVRAGFVAAKQFANPEAGDVMVVSLGGSISFYVFAHHEPTVRRLVEFLQGSDFAGVIFSSVAIEGTFPLSRVRLGAGQGAPDVLVSMRWSAVPNDWGAPGVLTSAQGTRGRGTHASLSHFDVNNTLIAAGPDFKSAFVNELPSGNIDLAPTVLAILGITPPTPMDGRVLAEALNGSEQISVQAVHETLEASRRLEYRVWRQSLKTSRIGSVVYFDEGNGESRLE